MLNSLYEIMKTYNFLVLYKIYQQINIKWFNINNTKYLKKKY